MGPPHSDPQSPQAPPDVVQPGEVLSGKFRVERVLGVGGMGVVVAATHLQLGQLVALKFLLPTAMAYPENVTRFEREARAAVKLRSDHVAKVTDVGRLDDGAPYMVMEFLEGNDLDRVVRTEGPLPVQTAVDYVLQAGEAIAEAHALGIVHRDLKPKNLFLTHRLNGEPLIKVLDFGVSKVVGEGDLSLTATTQVLGSPSYMSPEQLRASRDVDQRTDIWALGTILYELLTAAVPFPANTLTQLTAMVIAEPPHPIVRPDIPAALAAIVMKCLEKAVEDRFQTVADLAAALAPFGSITSVALATQRMSGALGASSSSRLSAIPVDRSSARPTGTTDVAWDQTQLAAGVKPRRTWPIVAVAGVAAALVGALVVVQLRPKPAAPTAPTATTSVPVATAHDPGTPAASMTATPSATVSVVSAASVTTAPVTPHVVHVGRDAGVHTPATSNATDLPSTRN